MEPIVRPPSAAPPGSGYAIVWRESLTSSNGRPKWPVVCSLCVLAPDPADYAVAVRCQTLPGGLVAEEDSLEDGVCWLRVSFLNAAMHGLTAQGYTDPTEGPVTGPTVQ